MNPKINKLHPFNKPTQGIELPKNFTFPFNYTPHPLTLLAKEQLQNYLNKQRQWHDEIQKGKMFGVLVVEDNSGELGFLAAFSGLLDAKNTHDYFVPPIYDMQSPDGHFRLHEAEISNINIELEGLLCSEAYHTAKDEFKNLTQELNNRLSEAKECYKSDKAERDRERKSLNITAQRLKELEAQSIVQKNTIRQIKKNNLDIMATAAARLGVFEDKIQHLTELRRRLSAELQEWLFRQFRVYNNLHEESDMVEIFAGTKLGTPPAGAGECAAPKLLQYAYQHRLKPLAMAEFWKGKSPNGEIRLDGEFYPACKAKCEPILGFMLQGLDVDKDPLTGVGEQIKSLDIIYRDRDIMVINKPSGLLSAPGKSSKVSVMSLIEELYPNEDCAMLIHRLDMATSGVLVVALNKDAHKSIQAQFKQRTIKKHYLAVLSGDIQQNEGVISLPLSTDYAHRPCQMVDFENGKNAVTRYKVLEHRVHNNTTLVRFFPVTGRTHQLRVHSAHSQGLGVPIVGDALYGTPSNRLYLHSEFLRLVHPRSGRVMKFYAPPLELFFSGVSF